MNRTRFVHPALFTGLVLALGVTPPAQSGPGDLDVRFGTHGQTQVPGQVDSAALIALPDGRILVFGVSDDLAARNQGSIAVARLLANGAPDVTFGPGGHIHLRLGSEAGPVPTDALPLEDGHILVAGYFAGDGWGPWPSDQPRSHVPGWLVRLSPDGAIDSTFGVGGVARVGPWGIDRIVLLADGAIAAGAPGLLLRLESNGAPASFPGSEVSAVPLGSGYPMSAMVVMQDGGVLTSMVTDWDGWELFRVSASGGAIKNWGLAAGQAFSGVADFARDRDDTRVTACGSGWGATLLVQRWQDDGVPDLTFASATGGRVELGVEHRPEFRVDRWGEARCRAILRGPAGDHVVLGDWNKPYEYGGGHVLLAHLNASGALDAAFDRSGNGRELALGTPDQWSTWYVADAATASDGAALLMARGSSAPPPDKPYQLGEQRTVIARLEVSASQGPGSIGFNDAAVRISERRPGEVRVYRSGGTAGTISVRYELLPGTASAADVAPIAGTLTWADGDASARTIPLVPINDDVMEGEESLRVRLSAPTGGAGLGVPEIEVTIEDDEALHALQFASSALEVQEADSVDVTIMRPAATPGPVVVRYAVARDLDPDDGAPRPREGARISRTPVGELRWSGEDISSRTLRIYADGFGGVQPNDTGYVALADVSGTLREGSDWKVARITVVDNPALNQPPPTQPPTAPPGERAGGGGALSLEVLSILALVLLLRTLTSPAWALRLSDAIHRARRADCGDAVSPVRPAPGNADRP
jgi:hypothetical protein